jgi:hypothetical protein
MAPDFRFQKEWEDYRRRNAFSILTFVGYIPFMILVLTVFPYLFGPGSRGNDYVGFVAFAVWAVLSFIVSFRFLTWKCPACGKAYHSKWWYRNPFSAKCLHCKFVKYEGFSFSFNK